MKPSPPSASGTYLSVTSFSAANLFDTCTYDMIYLHREEISQNISLGLGLGNSQQNVHGHIAAIGSHSSPKTESVSDGSTCEHMSMTLLHVRRRPDIISIQTSPTLTAPLSCPG